MKEEIGDLRISVGEAVDPYPEGGDVCEIRLKWGGADRGPVRINGNTRTMVSLGLPREALGDVRDAIAEYLEA